VGIVVLGDGVEIGANSCVDRAKFGATVVGDGTKIDNLVQIAHNCRIGRSCLIAGLSGLAGSVVLEDRVTVAGHVGIADHISVGRGAAIGAKSGVMRDVPADRRVFGYPADDATAALRQMAAVRKLPDLLRRLSPGGEARG
jgi:UDP-3-O-[3-hydroxymyristoyl] glucosamine N-acyltransferase